MSPVPQNPNRAKKLPLHSQTQVKGLFGAPTANSHPLKMGDVGGAFGLENVPWIRLASAAKLEAEPCPRRIQQEQRVLPKPWSKALALRPDSTSPQIPTPGLHPGFFLLDPSTSKEMLQVSALSF